MPNHAIDRMALIKAPTRDYFLGMTVYEKSRIIKLNKTDYRIELTADSVTYYNKLNYRGYSLDALVFPDRVKISLQVADVNSGREFLVTPVRNFGITGKTIFDTLITDTTGGAYFDFRNIELKFFWSEESRLRLDTALAIIDKLAALRPGLTGIRERLAKLNNVSAGMVRLYNIDLKEIEKELDELNPATITGNIRIAALRSEGSYALYDSLKTASARLRKRFDHMIEMPEYEYFSEGYHALQRGEKDIAASYFLKSISEKKTYAPPFYYLAEMAYRRQDWDSCARTINHIINNLNPDFTTRKNTLILGTKLYNTLSDEAGRLLIKSRANEAINLLYIANRLCNNSKEMVCNGRADELLRQAKSYLFESWVSITDKSIENNKVDLAINYLGWTQDYYLQNSEYLSDTGMIDTLRIRLIHLLLLNASAKYNSGLYRKSIDYTKIADSLCLLENYTECNDDLLLIKEKAYSGLYNQLKNSEEQAAADDEKLIAENAELINKSGQNSPADVQKKYDELIAAGVENLEKEDYGKAYRLFSDAIDLEGRIKRNDSLPALLRQAAKPVILNDLKAGNLKAWGMHYKAVSSIIRMAREEALKTGLENDTDINNAIAKLEKLAYENKCAEVSQNFTRNLQTAEQNLQYKAYRAADKNWKTAIELARRNPDCNLDINIPLNKKDKYRNIVNYLETVEQAEKLAEKGDDSLSCERLIYAIRIYAADSLQRYKITKADPLDFAKSHRNSAEICYYMLKAITGDSLTDQYGEAVNLLLPYYDKNPKYRSLLLKTAAEMGKTEKRKNPKIKAKAVAKKLFPENKEMRKAFWNGG
jgi:hypothetical protein